MSSNFRAALFFGALLASFSRGAFAEPLTLDQAVEKAIAAAPLIKAGEAALDAAQAGKSQADVRPNPTVSVDAENFIGTGPIDVFRQPEVTVSYSQQIERGNKRAARIALADRDITLVGAQARVARLDIAAQVQRSFIDVQIAAEIVKIANLRLKTERDLQRESLRRVRAYKDPLFVETRAAARVAQAQINQNDAERRFAIARDALAAFWGAEGEELEITSDFIAAGTAPAKLADADEAVSGAAIDRARTAVVVEQSKAAQDYSVSGGLRYLGDTDDVAAVASISIPIGRFDKNKGNIARAQAERQQAEYLAEAARFERLRRLTSLRAEASAARTHAKRIITEAYPQAVRALEQVREGFNRGGFRFADIESAANAIVEVQESWLDAMNRFRDTQTEIDRLTGRFDVAQGEEKK
jgi:outer membrane protein, heavy metal efflux system